MISQVRQSRRKLVWNRQERRVARMQRAHIDRRGFVDHITLHLNDPLRDEGKAYARKLKEAGVAVTATRGTIHDFVLLNELRDLPGTQAALKQASEAIRDALRP